MDDPSVASTGGWVTFYCDDGTPYYYNMTTQATQWELPEEYDSSSAKLEVVAQDEVVYVADGNTPDPNSIFEDPGQHGAYNNASEADDLLPPPPEEETTSEPIYSYKIAHEHSHGDGFVPEGALVDVLGPELPPPPEPYEGAVEADDREASAPEDHEIAEDTEDSVLAMLASAVGAASGGDFTASNDNDDSTPLNVNQSEQEDISLPVHTPEYSGGDYSGDQEKDTAADNNDADDEIEFERVAVTMESVDRMNDSDVLDSIYAAHYLGSECTTDDTIDGVDIYDEDVSGICFDKDASFVGEMISLGICSPPSQSVKEGLESGRDLPVLRRRLEILDDCLQSCGSDEEWAEVIARNDFALVKYLQMHFTARVHGSLMDRAARCLALCSAIFPATWPECLADGREGCEQEARRAVSTVYFAAKRLEEISEHAAQSPRASVSVEQFGTYVGFDTRDVSDFNMDGMNDVLSAYNQAKEQEENELDSIRQRKLALGMVICQILSKPIPYVGFEVAYYRSNRLGALRMYELGDSSDIRSKMLVEQLLYAARCLLRIMGKEEEEVYISCVRSLAFINSQFPYFPNYMRHRKVSYVTEISELAAPTQTDGSLLAEGLMHAANEVGYPNHTSPEAAPVLRLCASLVCEPGHGGFFYTNDVRVLIDVIVRELTNLPAIEALEGSEETGLIEIKSMFIRLAGALADHSGWRDAASHYRMDELRHVISTVLEVSGDAFGRILGEMEEISEKFIRKIRSI